MIDTFMTPFGALAHEKGIYARRVCSAEQFHVAISAAHQAAWGRGEEDFVYTEQMARDDGVLA